MTFLTLKQRLARRRGANASTLNTLTSARYGDALNEAQRTILRTPGMDRLRWTTTTVTSVAGTSAYSVSDCAKINRIWETTNDIKIQMRTLAWLRDVDPDPQSGTPTVWIPTAVNGTTQGFLLWPTPASEVIYTLDVLEAITDMEEDDDEPQMPDDFHDLLIDLAELKEIRKGDEPSRYAMLQASVKQGMSDLKAWIIAHPDYFPVAGAMRMPAMSDVGGWYPAGR